MDETMNTRLLKIREKLANFSFNVEWEPGKTHLIADALSRAPVFTPSEEQEGNDDYTIVRQVAATDP